MSICLYYLSFLIFEQIKKNSFQNISYETPCHNVLKRIFWGDNFNVHLCCEMYYLRKQFQKALTFWNAFFEGAVLKSNYVLQYIFEEAILKSTYLLKCIFWERNYFGVYGCWLVWLLLYIFYQSFHHK